MYWLFLIVFPTASLSFVVDDVETCRAMQTQNRAYWDEIGVRPQTYCMRSFEV